MLSSQAMVRPARPLVIGVTLGALRRSAACAGPPGQSCIRRATTRRRSSHFAGAIPSTAS